jgi:phage terminase large subunit GpA-like protein
LLESLRGAADGLTPDPDLTVSAWADTYRMLDSKGSAEPGPWRTDRTPYLREIMDALSATSPVHTTVVAKGAQLGLTEAGNNWLGYCIHQAPGPILCLMPTDQTAEDNVRTRIDPLIETTPAIAERVPARGSKEGGNTLTRKDFPGGALIIRGANAPSKLRSLPIRYLMLDEVDAYELDLGGEGDPVALAQARSRTFGARRKVFAISTPTIEGRSRIWSMFEGTDQRRYFVPCPHCSEPQTIEWDRIRWDDDSDPWLACEHNGCVIEERHKGRMLAAGEWRPTADCADPNVRGYHLSALYSPLGWLSWRQVRDEFVAAKREKDVSKLKTWVNTVLGECWAEQGEAPEWARLYARREPYELNRVPKDGLVLTAGVDVQQNRLEVELRAWGPRLESWSIDYRVLTGDVHDLDGEASPWRALAAIVSETWCHELGGRIGLSVMAVDSGFATQAVYRWCRRFPSTRVLAVKGSDTATTLVGRPKHVDVRQDGQVIRHGATLWTVGSSVGKSELYGWIRQEPPKPGELAPTGWVHWPEYDEEYFRQLTAEQLVTRVVRGYRRPQWEKTRERNEALDCAVYTRAAAAIAGVDRFDDRRWDALRQDLSIAFTPELAAVNTPSPQVKRRGSAYWGAPPSIWGSHGSIW